MRPHLSSRRRLTVGVAAALIGAGAFAATAQAAPDAAPAPASAKAADTELAAASGLNGPYLYLGWGNPPNATDFMNQTGLKQVTLAFILASGGCSPAWDGNRPLTGGQDQSTIKAIQAAGGDVTPSIGGYSGNKLGEACSNAQDLAGAYQKVISAYGLKSIDIDIEASEVANGTVRQRVVDALKIIKNNNPGIKEYVTFGATPQGPTGDAKDMINKGAAAGLDVDGWAVMPFDFGDGTTDMVAATKGAVDGLASAVSSAYGISRDDAYRKVGFSSMNGKTDVAGESVSPSDFQQMVDYAKQHHLARVSFWAANRDRACSGGASPGDSCSGVSQQQWQFSKILAGYQG